MLTILCVVLGVVVAVSVLQSVLESLKTALMAWLIGLVVEGGVVGGVVTVADGVTVRYALSFVVVVLFCTSLRLVLVVLMQELLLLVCRGCRGRRLFML